MKTFKSIADVDRIRDDPLRRTIRKLVAPVIAECADYRPDDDLDAPWRLSEMPFESVTAIDKCFHAVNLPNDPFALGFLIPDAEWRPEDLRRHLEAHLAGP